MPSRDINDCVPELVTKIPLIVTDYQTQYPNRILKQICTLRSTAEQQALYAQGRTAPITGNIVTNKDGVTSFSEHNPTPDQPLSRAVDFGVFIGNQYLKQPSYYIYLGILAEKYQLQWGGEWVSLKDFPHIQVKNNG